MADAERRLAAIMFTDVVGYTALTAHDEEAGRRVRDRHEALVRPLIERYHGQWIEATGDESLSSFPSALDAVNCALAIQESLGEDPELKLRIGVHLGDVVFEGERVFGDGVNVASRIRPLAEPGGICVSDEVQHSIQNQRNIDTRSLGERELKNVPRLVHVFAVTGTASAPRPAVAATHPRERRTGRWAFGAVGLFVAVALGAWWWTRPAPDLGAIRSIAVLPLENLTGDPGQEYFADGMTEALIGDLARIGALSVISRTSVMRYKQSDKSLPEIAQELGVDGVVEGTVMRGGDHVRITAQLIDARSDRHLWSDRYDRRLSDVLALQSDVARAVAEQIRLKLTPEEQAALTPSRAVDPRAFDSYLRGLQLRGPVDLVGVWGPATIEQLEQAVELDPNFAEAWARLAEARMLLGSLGFDRRFRGELAKAREAARRALEIDDRLGRAHTILGLVRVRYDWDFAGGRRAHQRALQLSPSDPGTLSSYAWYLLRVEGMTEEALDLSERLLRVAPLDISWRSERLGHFFLARQYERALDEAERIRELDPNFIDIDEGEAYSLLGRFEEAHRASIAFWERCGMPCDWHREALERGWADGGPGGAARAWLEAATDREGYSPVEIARVYTRIGETEEAFAWLERGYRERDPWMIDLKVSPSFDPIRSDPRFDDLLRRIGFPEE